MLFFVFRSQVPSGPLCYFFLVCACDECRKAFH